MKKYKNAPAFFYLGTLISSVGSLTFTTSLIIFMLKSGYSFFQATLIVGLFRLISAIISTIFGETTDRLNPVYLIVVSEFIAALSSVGIFVSWSKGSGAYLFLLLFCLIRAALMALQTGSRAKLAKSFSADDYDSNSKHAIWLNKATQGATLFSGVLTFAAYKWLNFNWVIAFDALTFVVNGVLIIASQSKTPFEQISEAKNSAIQKFRDFYTFGKRAAFLDLSLAVIMMGNAAFNTRLAGHNQAWNPILIAAYGGSVWIAGFLERTTFVKSLYLSSWFGLAATHVLLGFFPDHGWLTLCISLVKDTFFWLIFHRITTHLQIDTPQARVGSVFSARLAQLVVVVSCGEILVGWWQKFLPVSMECFWRAGLAAIVMAVLYVRRPKVEYEYARPSL